MSEDTERVINVPNKVWTRIIGTGFDMYHEGGQVLGVLVRGNSIIDVDNKAEVEWRIRAHRMGTP